MKFLLTKQVLKLSVLRYVFVFLLGALMLLGGLVIYKHYTTCTENYNLINPQLRCADGLEQGEWDYKNLREKLIMKKSELKDSGVVSHLSIYFRDLKNGPRFGIGEYDQFHPASLRKVPILMVYLHLADLNPEILEKIVTFSGSLSTNMNVDNPEQTIQANTSYTVRELLRKMIVYSDNYSFKLLTDELNITPPVIPYYTFRDLDVLRMMFDANGDYISIQSYASLFGVLYNTGYLSKNMSQYALELLSQSTFKEGLVAGIPENTRVAHKFGQRYIGKESELHDCGIVYHPSAAYILCVMTSGTNLDQQKSVIAGVSQTVFEEVSLVSNAASEREILEP